jgi:hypothetical protein
MEGHRPHHLPFDQRGGLYPRDLAVAQLVYLIQVHAPEVEADNQRAGLGLNPGSGVEEASQVAQVY